MTSIDLNLGPVQPLKRQTSSDVDPEKEARLDGFLSPTEDNLSQRPNDRPRGVPGPPRKPRLTHLEQAWFKCARSEKRLSNKDLAKSLKRSKRWLSGGFSGEWGLTDAEKNAIWGIIGPVSSGSHALTHFSGYSHWLENAGIGSAFEGNKIDVNGSACGGEKIDVNGSQVRYSVILDGLTLSGRSENAGKLIDFFKRLAPESGEWRTFDLPTPSGPQTFTLSYAGGKHMKGFRGVRPGFRHAYNLGIVLNHPTGPYVVLVAKIYIGAAYKKCCRHRWVRGPHKREGRWRNGCWTEAEGKRCPDSHFISIPHRCGKCDFPNEAYRHCPQCQILNGLTCLECAALNVDRQDMCIEVKGRACALQVHVPVIQHLFARFVIPETVVRESCDIALDLELPFASILPFQNRKLLVAPQRPLKTARTVRNAVGDDPPGLYIGSKKFKAYEKFAEIRHRQNFDLTAALPEHMRDWLPDHGTRLEFSFSPDQKSSPGRAQDLSTLAKIWNTFALADMRRLNPGTIESELVLEAKMFGFADRRKPSRKRVKEKRASFDLPHPESRRRPWAEMDAQDVWILRQNSEKGAEKNAQVLSEAAAQELRKIEYPFSVGKAVEGALPKLEAQIHEALKPPAGLLPKGELVDIPPGIVIWKEKNWVKKVDREAEECLCQGAQASQGAEECLEAEECLVDARPAQKASRTYTLYRS